MVKLTRASILALIFFLLLPALPVMAAEPPDLLQIKTALVVRNVATTGDVFIAFHYCWAYNDVADIPSELAKDVILFRFLAPNSNEELASNVPYSMGAPFKRGYQQGISGFYFSTGNITLNWEDDYTICMIGNPAIFGASCPVKNYILTPADYVFPGGQEDNQELLGDYILDVMRQLEIVFNTTLRGEVAGAEVLNSVGDAYIRGAISRSQSMAPKIFFVQFSAPDFTQRDWEQEQATFYEERYEDSIFAQRMDKAGEFIGISGRMLFGLALFAISVYIAIRSHGNWRDTSPALIAGAAILTGGALAFGIPWAIWATVAIVAAYIITWMLFLRYAG